MFDGIAPPLNASVRRKNPMSAQEAQERPSEVITAVGLMGVGVVLLNYLRTTSVILGMISGRIASADIIYKTLDECLIWGFSLGLVAFIWAGVNAARWITLVLDVANFAYFAFRIVASGHLDGAAMIYAVYMILESIALYLVFISQGKRWFRRSTVAASA
jgi:hypothetical protein